MQKDNIHNDFVLNIIHIAYIKYDVILCRIATSILVITTTQNTTSPSPSTDLTTRITHKMTPRTPGAIPTDRKNI